MNPITRMFVDTIVHEFTHSKECQKSIICNTELPGVDKKLRKIPSRIATELLEGKTVHIGYKDYRFDQYENKVVEV